MRSAWSIRLRVRRMPSASTGSAVSRKPAVSTMMTGQPAEIATNLDEIAGRAWNGRNDRGIALAQSIEQRGFSGIGRP